MEKYKIDNFKKENQSIDFPWHRSLSSIEIQNIVSKLSKAVGDVDVDPLALVKKIQKTSLQVDGINAEDSDFSISRIFEMLKIHPAENIFINWYRYDVLDEVRLDEFNHYFANIWYPSADDIDIFYISMDWIISISHHCIIRYIKFQNGKNDR